MKYFILALAILLNCSKPLQQKVFFIEPKDGSEVTSPFQLKFGVENLEVAPAGDVKPNSGHHHLLINLDPQPNGEAIPFDDMHKHFGKAQTETELTLSPGKYKLTLQFANGAHQSYGSDLSQTINITVKE